MKSGWWAVSLVSGIAAFLLYVPFLYLKSFDFESVFYVAAVVIATAILGMGILMRRIAMKRWTDWRLYPAVAAFWIVTAAMFLRSEELRPWARWAVASEKYKNLVLQQNPDSASGLRHLEWDGWGWAGMDTSVQLVYDPTDSLQYKLRHDQTGPFAELAAKTAHIQRLSKGWYSLTLYTSEDWDAEN